LFDAVLHLATLLAILIYFRIEWLEIIKAWSKNGKDTRSAIKYRQLGTLLIIATTPALITGWLLNSWIEINFRSLLSVAVGLILTGILLWTAEKFFAGKAEIKLLTWPKALSIGLAQAFAILPGISRSGATIVTGMYMGLRREAAARFSFLMAAPIILAAGGYSLFIAIREGISFGNWQFMAVAFVIALLFSFLAISGLMKFVKKYSLQVFAWYLILAGIALIVVT
jgi:undecaprenyl-diphosphatase